MVTTSTTLQTKKVLAESLKKLMAIKPLNKISIKEIADDCGYNRQTFYYHFQDIYDLVEWIYKEETISLFNSYQSNGTLGGVVLHLLEYLKENKAVALCSFHSMGHTHLKHFFYKNINEVIMSVVNEYAKDLQVSEEHKAFIAHFYTISFVGIIENWLEDGFEHEPEELVFLLELTIKGNIRGALERFSESSSADSA